MSELGRIPVRTKLACPGCSAIIEPQSLPSQDTGEGFRCAQCRQSLRIPAEFWKKLAPETTVEAKPLPCPACQNPLTMFRADRSKLEIDHCCNCRGIWFDGDELKIMVTDPAIQQQFQLPTYNDSPVPWISSGQRHCPRCSESALKQTVVGEVTVDVCPFCKGTWLDSGELERLTELHHQKSPGSLEEYETERPAEEPSLIATIWRGLTKLFT